MISPFGRGFDPLRVHACVFLTCTSRKAPADDYLFSRQALFFVGRVPLIIYNVFRLLWRRLASRRVGRLIRRSHNGKSSRNRVAVAGACLLSMKISERFRVGHLPGVCPRKKPASKRSSLVQRGSRPSELP